MVGLKATLVAALFLGASLGAGVARAQEPAAASGQTAQPQPGVGIVHRRGQSPVLDGRADDMAFAAGDLVRISAQVADDIFAAGRELRVEGASADHLIIAGGELDLAPAVLHDLIAAGGRIRLRAGVVNDDVLAAGGELSLDRNVPIRGSVVVTGGRVRIESAVGGSLTAAGDRVELNGPVGHNVRIRANEIVVGPEARIGGDLYAGGARIEISPAAVVQGRTVREVIKPDRRGAARIGLMGTLLALGVLLMNGVVAAVAPDLVGGVDQRLRSRFWPTLGLGALIVVLAPLAMGLLAATVLGAPLAVILALAYLLAVPIAFAAVAYWIGQLIRRRVSSRRDEPPRWPARFGWTVLGALLILLVCLVPYVGWLAWLAALAAGMGGLAVLLAGRGRPPAAAAT